MKILFRWYDLYAGIYIDRKNQFFYIVFFMIVLRVPFWNKTKKNKPITVEETIQKIAMETYCIGIHIDSIILENSIYKQLLVEFNNVMNGNSNPGICCTILTLRTKYGKEIKIKLEEKI